MPDRAWRGLRTTELADTLVAIERSGHFAARPAMELDARFKQIIPYLVLRDGPRWFLMRRTRAGGDARLHDHWSIGLGGHLNPADRDLLGGLEREWREEVLADFAPECRLIGLLNDDDTEVGRVHLGVVYVAEVGGRKVSIRETDKLSGAFATTEAVEAVREHLESWSCLVFDALG